jgi:tetratricopeptide (TPR) repeat protein
VANPRIDELRRRIEREPGSRLFAQLAEELRKDGELTEAIRVARTGLAAHPNYPSARLTLGRALFETGQFGPARSELESVLRGAPDNILAARLLAECLEGLGDAGAALLQYRAAQRLSPGDKQIEVHVRGLEQRLQAGSARVAAGPAGSAPSQPAAAAPTASAPTSPPGRQGPLAAAPSPLGAATASSLSSSGAPSAAVDDFEDVFEPSPAWKRSPQAAPSAKEDTILLLEDEAPTLPGAAPGASLDRPLQADSPPPATVAVPGADTLAGAPAFFVPPSAPDFDSAGPAFADASASSPTGQGDPGRAADQATSTAAFAALGAPTSAPPPSPPAAPPGPPEPLVAEPPEPLTAEPPVVPPHTASPSSLGGMAPPEVPKDAPGANLSTPTLAELYCDQGFFDKAAEVYEQILEHEPHNERARARLVEIKALARALPGESAPPDPRAAERSALQRKIARLEQMLLVVRRG